MGLVPDLQRQGLTANVDLSWFRQTLCSSFHILYNKTKKVGEYYLWSHDQASIHSLSPSIFASYQHPTHNLPLGCKPTASDLLTVFAIIPSSFLSICPNDLNTLCSALLANSQHYYPLPALVSHSISLGQPTHTPQRPFLFYL